MVPQYAGLVSRTSTPTVRRSADSDSLVWMHTVESFRVPDLLDQFTCDCHACTRPVINFG